MAYIPYNQFQALLKKPKARKAKRRAKAKLIWGHAIGRKGIVKKLDTVFSLFTRLATKKLSGGKCGLWEVPHNNCGGIECCFHFLTRAKYATRWTPINAIGACFSSNVRYEHDQTFIAAVIDWFRKTRGIETWDALVLDSNQTKKWSNADLHEKFLDIKSKLEAMK